ncbi:3-oxoadipate enol-lactonase 2 [Daldinia childiae]|uniref:3-oxoadipate enol-lactonase 2 n=1 Tax=Daldinia childiae TaxID=326645 RepID=UPI001447A2CE|nr:3-oxoadipate enol-lactonase 2 [Daldinia childiae]KAF3056231.1 3-oxoadipate enol-lactonase 2 [Daldinia childiae]
MATSVSSLSLSSSRTLSYALTPVSSKPEAPVVLLSNSLAAPFPTWDHVVPKLTSRGFGVLRYDHPGHGASSVPVDLSSTTLETMADDVRELLNHLSISRVHAWIGVSMGAATGIVFAAKYPGIIEKLVVCNTISCSPLRAGDIDIFEPMVREAKETDSMDQTVQSILERWFGLAWMNANPDETRRMRQIMLTTSIDGFETCCAALRSDTFDLLPLAEKAGQGIDDALFIVGENDTDLPEYMLPLRDGIQRGLKEKDSQASIRFEVIKNAGHVSYIDGYDQFIAVITEFLRQ